MRRKIIVGSRKSKLSIIQTKLIIQVLKRHFPKTDFQIKAIASSGDRLKSLPLVSAGIKGIFVKELERALLEKKIDCAVHSAKDLPVDLPRALEIAAIYNREDPRDALIAKDKIKFQDLASGAKIGTSSPRRRMQLRAIRSDLRFYALRGNVETRINKLKLLNMDAIVVAYAALKRLKLTSVASEVFSLDEVLPAAGQGALAIEIRKSDKAIKQVAEKINHPDSYSEFVAEKSFLRTVGGGCHNPVAVLAKIKAQRLSLKGVIESNGKIVKGRAVGKKQDAQATGKILAEKLIKNEKR